jgi:bifunctional DNA-binding transcriptional regulator/antitoxin component of YhaV-PrlF toxin-antitoxin module
MDNAEDAVVAEVQPSGALTLPAHLRRHLGLEKVGTVIIQLEGDELHIRTVEDAMRDLQVQAREVFRDSGESVEKFLADRRTETRRDRELS